MRRLPHLAWIAAVLFASPVIAQCPPAPTSIGVGSGVCSLRVGWSAPIPGQVATVVVRRGPTGNYSDSVPIAIVNPAVAFYTDTAVPTDADAVYWVVFIPTNPQCPSPVAGPVTGTPYNRGSSYPRPTVTSDCNSLVTITGPSVFDATTYRLSRRGPGETSFQMIAGPVPIPFFLDPSASVGGPYEYLIFPSGECGSAQFSLGRVADIAGTPAVTPGPAQALNVGQNAGLRFSVNTGPDSTQTLLRDGVEVLPARPVTSGSALTNLFNLKWSDAGAYTLRVVSPCGTTESAPLVLAVRENPCRSDFNDSGSRDVSDIFAFLSAWFAGCP